MVKKIINCTLCNQTLRINGTETTDLYQDSLNYLYLKFKWTNSWEDCNKSVIFKKNGQNYQYSLTSNILPVPNFLLDGNSFKFTVLGVDTSDDSRITTKDILVSLKKSGFTEDISSYPDDVSDVYTVLLEKFDEYYTKEESYNQSEVDSMVNNKANLVHTHTVSDLTDWRQGFLDELDYNIFNLIGRTFD